MSAADITHLDPRHDYGQRGGHKVLAVLPEDVIGEGGRAVCRRCRRPVRARWIGGQLQIARIIDVAATVDAVGGVR